MTSLPPRDPLVSFWQTAPMPDTHLLVEDLQRLDRLHRRHTQSVFAIVSGIALLLLFEDATGRLPWRGFVSGTWIAGIVAGFLWQRRARCNRLDALTLDTIRLLKAMIARAKSDLFVARCLYAGVPLGATVGYLISTWLDVGKPQAAHAAHPLLERTQTEAGVAALITMVIVGAVLARSRRLQVRELRAKLCAIEADL